MIRVLVQRAKTFGIHDDHLNRITIRSLSLNWLRPHPHTLGARIDGWSNAKAIASVQKHAVQQIALARSVHARHGHNTEWPFQAR